MEILNKVGRLSAQEMLEKIEKAALINYGLTDIQSKNTFPEILGKELLHHWIMQIRITFFLKF